jgi:hypothetical protein
MRLCALSNIPLEHPVNLPRRRRKKLSENFSLLPSAQLEKLGKIQSVGQHTEKNIKDFLLYSSAGNPKNIEMATTNPRTLWKT